MNSVTINGNIMILDVLELFNERKKSIPDELIITNISSVLKQISILIINVGQSLTISKIEKNSTFVKKIATMFYSCDGLNIETCKLLNTPRSFTTIFNIIIKPLLTKDALKIIDFCPNSANKHSFI